MAQATPTEQPTTPTKPDQLWSATFVLIIFLTFAGYIVNQGLNAGSSVYLSFIGEPATLAGIGAALFSIAGGLARLFGGKTIDQRGRAKCIVAGMIAMTVFTFLPVIDYTGIPFVIFRIMQGVAFGIVTTATATAAADVLPFSRLNEGIGYAGLGQALAMSAGPAFALALVATDPHTNMFLGLICFAVLGLIGSFFLRYEKKPTILPEASTYRKRWEELKQANASSGAVRINDKSERSEPENITEQLDESDKAIKGWRKFLELSALPGAITLLIFSPCMGFMIYFGGLLGNAVGASTVGLFFTVSAITMIIIRICSKAFMNTVPPIIIMGVAVIGGLIAYALLIALSMGFYADMASVIFLIAGFPYGVATGLVIPINQAIAVRSSSAERWGAANATFLIAMDVGIGISCIFLGMLSDMFGFTFVLCCIAVCIALSWVIAFFVYPKKEKR